MLAGGRLFARSISSFTAPISAIYLGSGHQISAFPKSVRLPRCQIIPLPDECNASDKVVITGFDSKALAVLFDHGSVVFVNVAKAFRSLYADRLKSDREQPTHKEEYSVVVEETVNDMSVDGEQAVFQHLDLNGIRIVTDALALSVSLHHYEQLVDKTLAYFQETNSTVIKTGRLKSRRRELFQAIAEGNQLMAEVIGKLRVLEGSDVAWKFVEYEHVWESLHDEFDLFARFKNVETKLNLVTSHTRFFLDVSQHNTSNLLEITIIALIAVEILLGIATVAAAKKSDH